MTIPVGDLGGDNDAADDGGGAVMDNLDHMGADDLRDTLREIHRRLNEQVRQRGIERARIRDLTAQIRRLRAVARSAEILSDRMAMHQTDGSETGAALSDLTGALHRLRRGDAGEDAS